MNEDNLDPTTLICLDRAGYAFVMTEAHPPQRLPGRCILKRRFLTKLINPKCELDLRDLDAEDSEYCPIAP